MVDVNARVQAVLNDLVYRDVERGLQVAAYFEGQLVVDAWAGLADTASPRPVNGDTLFCAFSVSKGIVATVIHLLAERGQLEYDAPIAQYWPAFGAHGKQQITLRQVLTHTAGIPQMPDGVQPSDICDWDKMCEAIANLTPLWQPGTAAGYHAFTFGWILGQVAQCATGQPFASLVQEEICQPLGITSLFFGIPDAVEPQVAQLESGPPPPWAPPPPDALVRRVIPLSLQPLSEVANRPDFRRAVIPAGNGIMNARAIARHYAALACGDLDGVRLLSEERIRIATTLQSAEVDQVMGFPMPRALGYTLGGPLSAMGERPSAFGHRGAGGSVGFADPVHRFAFGLTKTRMVNSLPGEDAAYLIAREVRAALDIPESG